MGLAASQARYLLLTARKSDLEYRAQMISQRKIALAMETEQVATAYTDALNNRHLMFTFTASASDGKTSTEEMTYKKFTSDANTAKYRVIDPATGKIVCTDPNEATRYVKKEEYANFENREFKDWKTPESEKAYNDACAKFYKENMLVLPALKNEKYFQDALQAGTLVIEKGVYTSVDDKTQPKYAEGVDAKNPGDAEPIGYVQKYDVNWEPVVLSGMDDVSSELYTDDDPAASATYEHKSLLIQAQDKQLDVELKQVETQLEACKNEQESVKNLIKDRAGKDFKLFG